ncbi:MAG: B12-binding domain-containing radical SAM protein [Candidatus Omnitrophica bacterium]|nr:B12-binding domain-containing radical SAM protein [Candidatus Omnitrophota bacterium]
MRITFVGISSEQLGVSMMSSLAKLAGHDVRLAFSASLFNDRQHLTATSLISSLFDDSDIVLKTIKEQMPDVIAFSPVSGIYQWSLSIAERAKAICPDARIVFGGIHATAVPESVLAKPFVDFVCVGEGDVSFPAILKAIEKGEISRPIANTHFKLPNGEVVKGPQVEFIQDLDSLPIYDKTIWEEHIRYGDTYITMVSRGCPYRCTFCFNSFVAQLPERPRGKYVRYRSVDHVMHELREAKRRYRFKMVEFFDDIFTLDKEWLKEFLPRYKKEIGVCYQIFTHIKFIDDDVARLLADSGCRTAEIGLQTVDDEYKRKRLNRYETSEQAAKALAIMKKYGIHVKFDHMLGLPGESVEMQEKARQFYVEHTPYRIMAYWTNFFPGTKMLQDAIEAGILTPEDVRMINEGKCFDSFTVANRYIDSGKNKTYKIYETIFTLLPGLPPSLRKRVTPGLFKWMPAWLLSMLTLGAHIVIGIVRRDPDPFYYFTFYAHHVWRIILLRLGIKPPLATRIVDSGPIQLKAPKKMGTKSIDQTVSARRSAVLT